MRCRHHRICTTGAPAEEFTTSSREATLRATAYTLLPPGSLLAGQSDGLAGITADANLRINFNLAEKRDAERLRHVLTFAVAKHINASFAMRAVEVTHILDHAENLNINLAKHLDGLAHVGQRHDRRRGDDHCASNRDALNQRKLHI